MRVAEQAAYFIPFKHLIIKSGTEKKAHEKEMRIKDRRTFL